MALLQYRAPVDYEAQQEAFRDFLENFKSSESASEETATNAINGLHIDGDATRSGRDDRSRRDKRKYISLLQDIADRVKSNILIELDDLDLVSPFLPFLRNCDANVRSVFSMNDL